jgi:uncharacterized membrane protein
VSLVLFFTFLPFFLKRDKKELEKQEKRLALLKAKKKTFLARKTLAVKNYSSLFSFCICVFLLLI